MQYHLTSDHRNRQAYRQTGVLLSVAGEGLGQYRTSAAYRRATTGETGQVVTNHNHLSCPVAITRVTQLQAPSGDTLTGAWQLISTRVQHFLPRNYPRLHGFYATIALGNRRCLLKLIENTDASTFTGQLTSLLTSVYGYMSHNNANFPRLPHSGENVADLVLATTVEQQPWVHVTRQPPLFYLESVPDRVELTVAGDGHLLRVSMLDGDFYVQRMHGHITGENVLLLHVGGMTGVLDPPEVCATRIFGIDAVVTPPQRQTRTRLVLLDHNTAITTTRTHQVATEVTEVWWCLEVRLAAALPTGLLPTTAYIELWGRVTSPTYGPPFVLNRIQVPQPITNRTATTKISVRVLYTSVPSLGILRSSGRLVAHIAAWWIAVRFSETGMTSEMQFLSTAIPSNANLPSWVQTRGTLLFRSHLEKYTHGVTLAIQLVCQQPHAQMTYSGPLTLADIGLPQVCILTEDGEVLDLVPVMGGENIPIEGGPPLADDIACVGLQIEYSHVS